MLYFLKNKTFTFFLLIISIVSGFYSLGAITKEYYPEIKVPVVLVTTIYPGANPQEIEETITDTLEESLLGSIDGVDEINSRSQQDVSVITLQFFDDVNLAEALVEVKDKVDEKKSELPEDAQEPVVSKVSFSDEPVFTFALSSRQALTMLRTKAEDIESRLVRIPGVSEVDISGIPEREVTVLLDPIKLSRFKINPTEVVSAISQTKQTLPAGSIVTEDRYYKINVVSNIDDVTDIENIVVESVQGNASVYVKDLVLTVEDGVGIYKTQSRIAVTQESTPQQAVVFNVRKQEGGDITEITNAIRAELENYANTSKEAVEFVTIFDAGKEIAINLSDLTSSGFQTIALVVIVMGLMVGFRESIIAALAVPMSFLLAFTGMIALGQTINFITLFSLILVIGILIDSAIVVVEGIYEERQKGATHDEASERTLKIFGKPIIAGVLTTMSIFFPLMMLSGVLGQFIGGIPRVINIVLAVSVIVALVFIPQIAKFVYALPIKEPQWLVERREEIFKKLALWYKEALEKILDSSRTKKRIGVSLIVIFISSFVLVGSGLIQGEFFPPDELDRAYINIELSEGSTLRQTSEALIKVEEIVAQQEHVTAYTSTVGSENVFVGPARSGEHFGSIVINVDEKKNGIVVTESLRSSFSEIKGFRVQVLVPESGPPVGAPFQVRVTGENWDDINGASEVIAGIVSTIGAARDIDSGVSTGLTDIELNVQKERLAEYNLTPLQFSSIVRSALYGVTATTIKPGNSDQIDINVKVALNPESQTHTRSSHITYDQLQTLPIQTTRGEVLLGYFVEPALVQSSSQANHRDGVRTNTVTAYVNDGFLPIDIVNEFSEKMADVDLPGGVEYVIAGATDENDQASSELLVSLLFGLFLIIAVLVWQFGSFRDTLFIISVIPLGLIGVLYGLFFSGMNLSFTAMLGFIALVGIVVNDSIILVDVINSIRKAHPQKSLRDVVVLGSIARLRPILLTTVTTVLGMIPLLFVSPIWTPFAFSLITGLTFATILTLIVIPMIYLKWKK